MTVYLHINRVRTLDAALSPLWRAAPNKRKNSRAIFPFVLRVNSICLAAFEDNWTRSQEKERATEREEGIKESGFPLKLFPARKRVCVGFFFICDTRLDLIPNNQKKKKTKRLDLPLSFCAPGFRPDTAPYAEIGIFAWRRVLFVF